MAVQSRGSHICMWRPLFGLRFRPCAAQGSCGLPGTYHAFRGGPLSRGVRTALELQGTYSTFCGRPRSRLPKAPQLVFLGYPRFFGGGGGGGGEGWGWGEGKNYCPFFMKTCTQIKESTHIILAFLGVLAKSWARAWADLRGLSQYE